MTRQYDFHRSNESSQKDDDNWILQRSAVRQPPAKTLTPQTKSTAGDRSGIKLDLTQIPVSNYSANSSPLQALAQRDGETPVQRQEEEKKAENKTGLPDSLKEGIESLSGFDLSGVRVNYNSPKPAQLNAHAYTQGQVIEVAPGQERHLPHESWHVVQQMQGRVRPTMEVNGVGVNGDRGLEREADAIGAKAVQIGKQRETGIINNPTLSTGMPIQKGKNEKVAQLVLATVNPQNGPINLAQKGNGGFMVMYNLTQPEGREVSDEVGFAGVLNKGFAGVLDKDAWAGLGKSPTDYWRAHAYAKSFGGAGNQTNVGWWKESSEKKWTENEQKVRGAGSTQQIEGWQPGIGERGTYLVEREMHPQVLLKDRYRQSLVKAVEWGFDESRAAWVRAIATTEKIYPQKAREKRVALLETERSRVLGLVNGRIGGWVDQLFGTSSLETNLIKKMKMKYTIKTRGSDPGKSRRNLKFTESSPKPNPIQFGLDESKIEDIWKELVNHNNGIFAQGNAPVENLVGRVKYTNNADGPPQELRAYADGWGVA